MSAIVDTAARGVLDAAGSCTVSVGPPTTVAGWKIKRASVSCDSTASTACKVYRNFVSPSTFIDGTVNGNVNADDLDETIAPGERLIFVWTNGTPGANATATVFGTLVRA